MVDEVENRQKEAGETGVLTPAEDDNNAAACGCFEVRPYLAPGERPGGSPSVHQKDAEIEVPCESDPQQVWNRQVSGGSGQMAKPNDGCQNEAPQHSHKSEQMFCVLLKKTPPYGALRCGKRIYPYRAAIPFAPKGKIFSV